MKKLEDFEFTSATLSRDFKRVPFIINLKPDHSFEKTDEDTYHDTVKYRAVEYHEDEIAKMINDGDTVVLYIPELSKNGDYHFYNYPDEDKLESTLFDYIQAQEEARYNARH